MNRLNAIVKQSTEMYSLKMTGTISNSDHVQCYQDSSCKLYFSQIKMTTAQSACAYICTRVCTALIDLKSVRDLAQIHQTVSVLL